MPELPEVEVVRRGVERWVAHRTVAEVEVLHPRAVRRHLAGADDFADRLKGHRIGTPSRRGKYLWLPLEDTDQSILAHLGMSGQLLVQPHDGSRREAPAHPRPLRPTPWTPNSASSTSAPSAACRCTTTPPTACPTSSRTSPATRSTPLFDDEAFHRALRRKRSTIKRALLDQSLISGVGNIYADEALWRAGVHYERPTATFTRPRTLSLLGHVRDVMNSALAVGGTSFDSLYVNVNGESGYFDRSLDAYGREGLPCRRCGTPMRRRPWMNRSSYYCPKCQRPPRITP